MITKTDLFVIRELLERVENDEIDVTDAMSRLDAYCDAQRRDSMDKVEKGTENG